MNALIVAAAYVFTPVVIPGASSISNGSINDKGQAIVQADFRSGVVSGTYRSGPITPLPSAGSAVQLLAFGINNAEVVVGSPTTTADPNEKGAWSSNGPFGGWVNGLAVAKHTVYAATPSGAWVLKGDDGSWSALGTVVYASSVAVDPINSSNLYVAGSSFARHTGFLRSTDRGLTWDNPVSGLPFNYYNTVVVNPVNPSNVFVAGVTGVYKSFDGGVNWQGVNGIPTTEYIASIAVNPLAPATVFAAGTGGVYRSVDGGSNFVQLFGGIGSYSNSVAIDAKPASVAVYAVINWAVYRSVDNGNSWTPVAPIGPTEFALTVAIGSSPKSSSSLFALASSYFGARSVFKSLDAGASWTPVSPSHPANDILLSFAVDPARQSTLYTGASQSGVSASFDGGANWATVGRHLVGMTMSRVAVAPSAPNTVYGGSYNDGIFVSTDHGKTWAGLGADAGGTSAVLALTVSPIAATTAYAGTGSGALVTVDGGATWSPMNSGLPLVGGFNPHPPAVTALVVDPATPNTIYAGTDGAGIYKTTDGHNWTPASNGLAGANVYSVAINPKDPNTLYASTYDGTEGPPDSRVGMGVFKSTDGGAHWTPVSVGLTNMLIRTLSVDPTNPTTLYAGCNGNGIFKSVNGAATWTLSNNGVGSYPSNIVVDPADSSTVYASTFDTGVFQSDDFGNTWNPINRGLDVPSASLQWLALDPTSPHRLYIATFMRGVASMVIDRSEH